MNQLSERTDPDLRDPIRYARFFLKRNFGSILTIIVLLLMIFASDSLRNVFFRPSNLVFVLRQLSVYLLVSCGLTFVILSGGIDISVGSTLSFAAMAAAVAVGTRGLPLGLGILSGLAAGIAIGALNGALISWMTIPPFIVTIATFSIFRGAAFLLSNGASVRVSVDGWDWLGKATLFGIPVCFFAALLIYVPAWILLNKTTFGKHIYAIGENPQAADFSGINVSKVRRIAYLLSGFSAGMAGVIAALRLSSVVPTSGYDYEIDALAAIVIGGTSIRGGSGRLSGTFFGCVLITVLASALMILTINSYWRFVIKGVVILVGVAIEFYRYRRKSGRAAPLN